MKDEPTSELVTRDETFAPTAQSARSAVDAYLEVQKVFDEKLPDSIMEIRGKLFRKKSYWRAIATAFRVECKLQSEERIVVKDPDDWGYIASYRATTIDGRSADGDGACMASEKVDRYGKPTPMCTVHNVRAHAHTRAYNRAISNLVGFGEVSADEIGPDGTVYEAPVDTQEPLKQKSTPDATAAQLRKLGAVCSERAAKILDIAEGEAIQLGELADKRKLGEAIRDLAKRHVGCGETVQKREVDPLLVAIEGVQLEQDGTLVCIPAML